MTVLYVDTSALIKREVPEAESDSVENALADVANRGVLVVASALAWLEAWRSLQRQNLRDIGSRTESMFAGVAQFPLDDPVLRYARTVGGSHLRSLDAIHLASAIMVGADSMMTYDDRLGEAAESLGMAVLNPSPA